LSGLWAVRCRKIICSVLVCTVRCSKIFTANFYSLYSAVAPFYLSS
jgi:hypothetical protein